jgi:hypothetical protein
MLVNALDPLFGGDVSAGAGIPPHRFSFRFVSPVTGINAFSKCTQRKCSHILFAFSVLSYLFLYIAMENIVLLIGPQEKV